MDSGGRAYLYTLFELMMTNRQSNGKKNMDGYLDKIVFNMVL